MNAGITPGPFLKTLKADLAKTPDPLRAANNLHRFLSTGFSSAALHDFQRHPVLRQVALELFAQSQYLADILVRDPELFHWLTASPVLKVSKSRNEFLQEALASVQLFSRQERRLDALKRFHRREMLRIGARDVLKEADVVTVTAELSDLADAIVETVIQMGMQDLSARTGAQFRNTMAVVGLGKLGGRELNFSSDIDLLFVYDQDGEFDAPQERIRTFHEFYNRLAEFAVRKLTEHTNEGFLYRVDMRLRPEGGAGSLALSRGASLQYYEIRGQTWERQMLVKARPIAGALGTGWAWLEDLRPFIYQKTHLQSPLEELSDMKALIESKVDTRHNLKLGEGGIRDIEFVVQGLQLLNGGENVRIRESNTLKALEILEENKKLPKSRARSLAEAYRFLRKAEHRLQLLHGGQTHSIPAVQAEKELLARRLGFVSAGAFGKTTDKYRKNVRKIFDELFRKSGKRGKGKKKVLNVRGIRFLDPEKAAMNLEALFSAAPVLADPARRSGINNLLRETGAPDWALGSLGILANAGPIRRAFAQTWNNDNLARLVVRVAARSRAHADFLAREPLMFETLIGQPDEIFRVGSGWEFLKEHDIPKFEAYNDHKALIPLLSGDRSCISTFHEMSDLAERLLIEIGSKQRMFGKICLLALGKLGGKEITTGSDLDLILLYNREKISAADAEEVGQSVLKFYESSRLREIDFRLRPEGKNSPLAVEIGYYKDYLRDRASLWERQSLVKARVLCGDEDTATEVRVLIEAAVYGAPLKAGWADELRQMRERMANERSRNQEWENLKTGNGGLVDLEFSLQALQLRFGREHPTIRSQNSFRALKELDSSGVIDRTVVRNMERNMVFLRTLETFIRLNSDSTAFLLPADPLRRQALAAAVGKKSVASLEKQLAGVTHQNREIFSRVLELCEQ
ncbi:MAG: hypothetical protein WEF53_14270 [Bacteroidota bacterium]